MAVVAFGAYLALGRLKPKLSDEVRRRRSDEVARTLFRRLTHLPIIDDAIREIKKNSESKHWVRRGHIPVRVLKPIGNRIGLGGKGKLLGFLREHGIVQKSEARRVKGKQVRGYVLTPSGRKMLTP